MSIANRSVARLMLDVNRSHPSGASPPPEKWYNVGMLSTLLTLVLAAAPQSGAFQVGTASAPRGQAARGTIEVPAGVDAPPSIPLFFATPAPPPPPPPAPSPPPSTPSPPI